MYSQGRPQKDPKHLPLLSRTYPPNLGLLPNYRGYVPGEDRPRGRHWDTCVGKEGWRWFGRVGTNRYEGTSDHVIP